MSWIPNGDIIIIERFQKASNIIVPDDVSAQEGDVFVVKAVGCGYITDNGTLIAPEVRVGDMVILKGKMITITVFGEKFSLARAQDVLCYERKNDENINAFGD